MNIIHETNDYLIINKPAGMLVHDDEKNNAAETVVDFVRLNFPDIVEAGVGDDPDLRPGIVHRLDRDTSGVMVVARTQKMFEHLKGQFMNRETEKEYLAVVYGWIKNDEGDIDAPIGKSNKDFRMWSAQRGARGELREAITKYQVLKRFEGGGEKFSLMMFRPKTGRTHQIRVHAKYINHPIVYDELYGGKRYKGYNIGFARQALHAYALAFVNLAGQRMRYKAPLPEDFENILEKNNISLHLD